MIALRLNGCQISNIDRLRAHFNAGEIVRQRDAFASFANAHLRMNALGPTGASGRYYADMFAAAAGMGPNQQSGLPYRDNYWENPFGFTYGDFPLGECLNPCQTGAETGVAPVGTVRKVFLGVAQTALPDGDRTRLFYLLASAYLLADVTPEQRPFTAEEAESAYLGRPIRADTAYTAVPVFTVPTKDGETCLLPACDTAYTIPYAPNRKLAEGERIRTFRLESGQPRIDNGSASQRTVLAFRRKGDEQPEMTVPLSPGQYLYCNAVGNQVVKVLDQSVSNGPARLIRRKLERDDLFIETGDASPVRLPWPDCRHASSFAVESDEMGGLFIQGYHLNTRHYSLREMYPILSKLENIRAVEVRIAGPDFLVLRDDGRVYSNREEWNCLRGMTGI